MPEYRTNQHVGCDDFTKGQKKIDITTDNQSV